jgi:hypothetical protein
MTHHTAISETSIAHDCRGTAVSDGDVPDATAPEASLTLSADDRLRFSGRAPKGPFPDECVLCLLTGPLSVRGKGISPPLGDGLIVDPEGRRPEK